jgi:hypothetical protein
MNSAAAPASVKASSRLSSTLPGRVESVVPEVAEACGLRAQVLRSTVGMLASHLDRRRKPVFSNDGNIRSISHASLAAGG